MASTPGFDGTQTKDQLLQPGGLVQPPSALFIEASLVQMKASGSPAGRAPEDLGFGNVTLASAQIGMAGQAIWPAAFSINRRANMLARRAETSSEQTHTASALAASLASERQTLNRSLDQLTPNQRLTMVGDMSAFEQRARKDGLPESEIAATYANVSGILNDHTSTYSDRSRRQIAAEVLQQAAEPVINQGPDNTCALAIIESQSYSHFPAEASQLVADVVATGKYTTRDGRTITPDAESISKQFSSKGILPSDDTRSFASQIFQITAANIYLDQWNKKDGTDLRYLQSEPTAGHTGERVIDYSKHPPEEVLHDKFGIVYDGGQAAIDKTYAAITGDRTPRPSFSANRNQSLQQFENSLQSLQSQRQLPAGIWINDIFAATPFHNQEITGYDPQTGTVCVVDPNDASNTRHVLASDLYNDMYVPRMDKEAQAAAVEKILEAIAAGTLPVDRLHEALRIFNPKDRQDLVHVQALHSGKRLIDLLMPAQRRDLGVN